MKVLRRIDVLLNEETGERFNKNDVVKITIMGIRSNMEYIGRIEWIETLELTLDMSKEYKNRMEKIKYEDIDKIEKM